MDTQNVAVKDVSMSFWSMVGFMVKWSIATIPAIIILALLTVGTILICTALL